MFTHSPTKPAPDISIFWDAEVESLGAELDDCQLSLQPDNGIFLFDRPGSATLLFSREQLNALLQMAAHPLFRVFLAARTSSSAVC